MLFGYCYPMDEGGHSDFIYGLETIVYKEAKPGGYAWLITTEKLWRGRLNDCWSSWVDLGRTNSLWVIEGQLIHLLGYFKISCNVSEKFVMHSLYHACMATNKFCNSYISKKVRLTLLLFYKCIHFQGLY